MQDLFRELELELSNGIKKNAGAAAVIFVVIEDTLSNRRVSGTEPPIEPFDARGPGRVGITPSEAEVVGDGFDREVPRRPLRRPQDYVEIKVNRPRRVEQRLDLRFSTNMRILLAEFPIDRPLVL